MIYLDSAATSLARPVSVERAMLEALRSCASPGRGGHTAAMKAAETVYNCRCSAAALFNVEDTESIVFTFNATHALNMAIFSLVEPGNKVLISGFEHNSVTRPLHALGAQIIVAGRKLFDTEDTLEQFEKAIPNVKAVVCTHVSNVFGYILPIYEIARMCREHGKPLIIDASQSAGSLDIDAAKLSAAFIAMPGHKGLLGPQGTGILICGSCPKPFMHGGSGSDSILPAMPDYLPDRGEAGTHNVCGIAGLKAGIDYILERGRGSIFEHETYLCGKMAELLTDCGNIRQFYAGGKLQSGVLSFACNGADCESVAASLSERGVCVRSGLHCAPLAHESAGTLESGTIRLSFSPFIDENEISAAAEYIKESCA